LICAIFYRVDNPFYYAYTFYKILLVV